MKVKLHSLFSLLHSALAFLAALAWCLTALPARAQDNNVTISAADFQRLVYSAHLETQLALKPELGACLQTMLEMQRRNPNADPLALADVSRQALQFYRTNEPFYIRTNGYPDEILAAYLDALRHIPAHTNFVPANLTLLNYFMLDAADLNFDTNYAQTPVDLINSAEQQLLIAKDEVLNRQALVDDCVARAQGNAAFAAAMDSLLLPETGVSLQDTPAEIIGDTNSPLHDDDTNSPLHDDDTMTTLLALSQASGNGSLTVSSNELMTLFASEMQTIWDTINTNLAMLAQINESQPDYLAYLTNQAAVDANEQLQAAVEQGLPAKLASASAAVLLQSKLLPASPESSQTTAEIAASVQLAAGIGALAFGSPSGLSSLVSGSVGVFNLFGGGPSPDAAILSQLQNIQTSINDLSQNVNYRFDRVDQSLTTIFNTMNQQFSQINLTLGTLNANVDDIRSALMDVQGSLDRLATETFSDFDSQQQNPIYDKINQDLLYQVRHPGNGPIAYSEYQNVEPLFTTYATSEAGNSISCPTYTTLAPPESQFADHPNLEVNLNYIKEYLSQHLGVNTLGGNGYNGILVNPDEWFIAAYAYLQLAGENPMYFRKFTASDLAPIIGHGQNDTAFCASLTFIPGTTNINRSVWSALENNYFDDMTNFYSQISGVEGMYATNNYNFAVDTWRDWDIAAPRVTATNSALLVATPGNLIAAGSYDSLALKVDGMVVGWGVNNDGQITIPANLTNVMAIAAGAYHSLALKADGTVVGWGYNYYGQTNIPAGLSNVVAIAAGDYHSLALKADGTVVGWGYNHYGQTNIPVGLTNVVAIAAGAYHSLALKADGTIVGWGDNTYGEAVPRGWIASPLVRSHIAAGAYHSLALKADGTVVGWGANNAGQIAIPTNLTSVVAVAAGGNDSLTLKADGTVVGWGDNSSGQISVPASATNVVAIAAGPDHSLALRADGTVVGWGDNSSGETSVPASATNAVAIAAGGNHDVVFGWDSFSLALRADGTVVAWGDSHYGASSVPASATNVVAIAAGGNFVNDTSLYQGIAGGGFGLALRGDGTVVGWGDNSSGQISVPASATNVVAIAAGGSTVYSQVLDQLNSEGGGFSLALRADGTVVAWGDNTYGEISVPASATNVVAIAAGYEHSLALRADGTVVVWGDNSDGQTNVPANAVDLSAWGEYPHGLGSVPPVSSPITAVASGSAHCLALTAGGSVVAWGLNTWGQTDVPPQARSGIQAVSAGLGHSLALTTNGCVLAWGLNDFGQASVPANLTNAAAANVVAISAGGKHSLALQANGDVTAWGRDNYGQTDVPGGANDIQGQVVTIAAGGEHSLALLDDGTVACWGDNDDGQAPPGGPGLANVVAIAAGRYYSLALTSAGQVVAWGLNASGQCNVPAAARSGVVAIAAGSTHSAALKADGSVVVWGSGPVTVLPPQAGRNVVAIAAGDQDTLLLRANTSSGVGNAQPESFVLAELPERVGPLIQGCNQNTITELGNSGSGLDNAAASLSGAKMLLADVLQLGMPYTLANDGVLHGFLYGSDSLMDTSGATTFLQNQNKQLSTNATPQSLTVEGALAYGDFQNRLNQDLNNLQATGQPEIPRLVGQTLRLLNLLNDAWTQPTNSPPPALELTSQSNAPNLLLYGEPYMNYTLQYEDNLGAPGWTTTTLTNLQDEQTITPPFSGSPQRFYRLTLPTP